MKGFLAALQFLTVFRFKETENDFSRALYWFPAVGLIVGLLLCSVYWIWNFFGIPLWNGGMALCIVSLEVFVTCALHIDGLSDWADSFGSRDKVKRLEIMRDPRTGTFGVIAVCLAILFRLLSIYRILAQRKIMCLLLAPVISRSMMVEMCASMPYARDNGKGAPFVNMAGRRHRLAVLFSVLFFSCIVYTIKGLVLFILSFLLVSYLKYKFRKDFSGITGDLLGATNELTTVFVLFLGALL